MSLWARLQSKAATPVSGGATISVAFTNNVVAGSKLFCWVAGGVTNNTGATTGVALGTGETFTAVIASTLTGAGNCSLWVLDTPAARVGTKPTVTATNNNSGTTWEYTTLIWEVSGLATGSGTDGTPGTTVVSAVTNPPNPTYSSSLAGEYLILMFGDQGVGVTYTLVGSGYTADTANINSSGNNDIAVYYKDSTGGAETGGFTLSATGDHGLIGLVAFPLAPVTAVGAIKPYRTVRGYRPIPRRMAETEATAAAVTVNGAVANLALAAPAGTVDADATVTGAVAGLTLAAPAGTVQVTVNGVTPNLALASPAGTVDAGATVTGVTPNLALNAPAGTVVAGPIVNGITPNLALTAPAGSVDADAKVTGVIAPLALAAPAGTVTVAVNGVTPNLALAAPAGVVHAGATVNGVVAPLALTAPPGSASTTSLMTKAQSSATVTLFAGTTAAVQPQAGTTATITEGASVTATVTAPASSAPAVVPQAGTASSVS